MTFTYPFHFWYYLSSLKLFKLEIRYPRIVYCQNTRFNPVCWATNYYKVDLDDEIYYCYDYDDYEKEDSYYDEYYCYDNYDYEDCDDSESDNIEQLGLLDSHYYNQLLICSPIQRINGYTALASKHVLIADIDSQNMSEALATLRQYVKENDAYFKVYKTLNGMRYIQLDTIYQSVNRSAIDVLKYLGSDPKYIEFCRVDERFMARVTPKTNSEGMKEYLDRVVKEEKTEVRTCVAICYMGDASKIDRAAKIFVTVHDRFTNVMERDLPLG